MFSFPSTLNRGGSRINIPQNTNSLKDVLNNSLKSAFNSSLSKATSGRGYDTEGINYDVDPDRNTQLDNLDFTNEGSIKYSSNLLANNSERQASVFTPTKLNEAFFSVMNNYRAQVSNVRIETGNDAEVKGSNGKYFKTYNYKGTLTPSLFNPYHALFRGTVAENVPLLDGVTSIGNIDENEYYNLDNCSINELVRLSSKKDSILGQARYKYADFMYCKDLGKISNNHMITLRKFATPVADNIFKAVGNRKDKDAQTGDIGRMITWFDTDDNKLSDILSYEYEATWKQLNSKIQQLDSQEEDPERGLVGKFINNMSAGYNAQVGNGTTKTGGILGDMLGRFKLFDSQGTYANNDVALGRNYDNNKVYEPKDTIQDTHIYEGKLVFKHEFNLTFSYKLRAYDNINPKAAFLDLIGNILAVTYRKGTFWGGRKEILGAKPNQAGWAKYNNIMKGISSATGDFWTNIFHLDGATCDNLLGSFSQFISSIGQVTGIGDAVQKIIDTGKDLVNGNQTVGEVGGKLTNTVQKGAKFVKDRNLGRAAMGLMMNKLGRPALYAFDSLLSGANVGLWHVTIGNPKNPIAVFGNLIMTGCKITHSGPLGMDDFPTDLKVSVSLKHAMSRDAVDIQKMYTKGQNSIYLSLCSPFTEIQYSDGEKAKTSVIEETDDKGNVISRKTMLDNSKEVGEKTAPNTTNQMSNPKKVEKTDSTNNSSMYNAINNAVSKYISQEQVNEIYANITGGNQYLSKDEIERIQNKKSTEARNRTSELDAPNGVNKDELFLNKNDVVETRYAFCGSDLAEFLANKDEQR